MKVLCLFYYIFYFYCMRSINQFPDVIVESGPYQERHEIESKPPGSKGMPETSFNGNNLQVQQSPGHLGQVCE